MAIELRQLLNGTCGNCPNVGVMAFHRPSLCYVGAHCLELAIGQSIQDMCTCTGSQLFPLIFRTDISATRSAPLPLISGAVKSTIAQLSEFTA